MHTPTHLPTYPLNYPPDHLPTHLHTHPPDPTWVADTAALTSRFDASDHFGTITENGMSEYHAMFDNTDTAQQNNELAFCLCKTFVMIIQPFLNPA